MSERFLPKNPYIVHSIPPQFNPGPPHQKPLEFNEHASHQQGRTNHDFFSGSGSSYVIGKAENTEDDDWDF